MSRTIHLLVDLAKRPLPYTVQPGHALETLRYLRAAGWVDAAMPKRDGEPAVVTGITFAGEAVLHQVHVLDQTDANHG